MIDEISEAAIEAIEQAAGEAARAMALSMLEREAAMMRELQCWQFEAESYQIKIKQTQRNGWRNMLIAGLSCLAAGFVLGFTTK